MGAATASSLLAKRAAAADTASDQPLVPWCGQWFELEGVVVVVDVVAVVAFDEDVFVLPRPAAIAEKSVRIGRPRARGRGRPGKSRGHSAFFPFGRSCGTPDRPTLCEQWSSPT